MSKCKEGKNKIKREKTIWFQDRMREKNQEMMCFDKYLINELVKYVELSFILYFVWIILLTFYLDYL